MQTLGLKLIKGHLFADINGRDWVIDTGAPLSFGASCATIDAKAFTIGKEYAGLTAEGLSGLLDHEAAGLLGADVINEFDLLFDVPSGSLSVSEAYLSIDGEVVELNDLMGIPIIEVSIGGEPYRMFFDTGAKISYFQEPSLLNYPVTGSLMDFFPGFGQFETKTYLVDLEIEGSTYAFQFGTLPQLLGLTLSMGGTQGIVGNELIRERICGYFPRRKQMIIC